MLTNFKTGEWAEVVSIQGGQNFRQKLLLRGIQEGTAFRVISCERGPVVVEINKNTIVIGRGMAQKITARKIKVGRTK